MSATQSSRRTSVIPREGRAPHPGPPNPQPRRRGGPRGLPKRARRRRRMTLTHPPATRPVPPVRSFYSVASSRVHTTEQVQAAGPRPPVRAVLSGPRPPTVSSGTRPPRIPSASRPSRCPRALVFDRAGRLLILKPTNKSGWTIPGGVLETDGETPGDAGRREVAEELGLHIDAGHPVRLACMDFRRPARANSANDRKIAAPAPSGCL